MKLFVAYFLATAVNCALSFPADIPQIASIPAVEKSRIIASGNVSININDNIQRCGNQQNNNTVTLYHPKLEHGYVNISESDDYITAIKIHPTKVSWNEARKVCFYEGGFLAYATSKEEEDLFLKIMENKAINNLWVGIHNLFPDSMFLSTILGEVAKEVAYYTWIPGVQGASASACCIYQSVSGKRGLADSSCDTKYAFICKMKLYVKYDDPFESIMKANTVISYAFYSDEWFEVTPNRLDYREYWGDADEAKQFRGGQSIVFSLPSKSLEDGIKRVYLDLKARREFGEHFNNKPKMKHVGYSTINITELFDSICTELRIRRELGDYLKLPHERDPITSTMKDRFILYHTDTKKPTTSYIDLYLRVSYLGDSVITEIDRVYPARLEPFFAQEDQNMINPYECKELVKPIKPSSKLATITFTRGCKLICECTDADKCGTQDECVETDSTSSKIKKKKKKKVKDGSTTTEVPMLDKSTLFEAPAEPEKRTLNYADLLKQLKGKRRGSGPVNYIPKDKPCEPVCIPCCIPCCYDPCCPIPYCPPPVCCFD